MKWKTKNSGMVILSGTSVATTRFTRVLSYCPQPHWEAINGPRRAGSPVASSPITCAFHRFTPVVSSDRFPLLLFGCCGTSSAREWAMLFWRGSFTSISPSRRLLWNNIKNINLKMKSINRIFNYEKYYETWLRWWIAIMTRRADYCHNLVQMTICSMAIKFNSIK